jgi:membrane-bound lytic murein transglycosylase D
MTYQLTAQWTSAKINQAQSKTATRILACFLLGNVYSVANSAPYNAEQSPHSQQEENTFSQFISDRIQQISEYFLADTGLDNTNKKAQVLAASETTAAKTIHPESLNTIAKDSDAVSNVVIDNAEINSSNELIDIWPRIRQGFQLPADTGRNIETNIQNKILREELNWYAKNPDYIQRVLERAEPFLFYILEETEKHNLPTELVLLPIVESAFRPFAYSHGRAAGIWQFIPNTGRAYGLKQNWWYDGRRDIHASTQAALKYLTRLKRIFDGDWLLALAAYNSGEGTVKKAIRKNKKLNKPTDFWSLTLPKETRRYVPRLLALKKVITYPENYAIDLLFIADTPGFAAVKTNAQIDLALAADLAEIELETLYRFNPGFNRWATDPDGPHQLLLPTTSASLFETNYAALPANEHIKWRRHKIKQGESLGRIASKYHTSVAHLKKVNKIRHNELKEGKFILIPVSSKDKGSYALSSNERLKSIQSKKRKNKIRIEHTVKNGESFWTIAERYNVNMHNLAKWNGLAIRDSLKKGQKLVIWSKKKSTASSSAMTSIHYTVRSGDSLSRIASKYRVSVRDIHRWNSIKGKYLKPGQRLKLYIDVTEQSS